MKSKTQGTDDCLYFFAILLPKIERSARTDRLAGRNNEKHLFVLPRLGPEKWITQTKTYSAGPAAAAESRSENSIRAGLSGRNRNPLQAWSATAAVAVSVPPRIS
jgi:hypothetical protein